MALIDQISTRLKITTGDGKIYEPFRLLSSDKGSEDYNISEFHFPNIPGTKVDKREHKGTRYPLEFYFQGENHLIEFQNFKESLRSKKPCVILHPIFGQFTAHFISLEFDTSAIFSTKITCTAVETITEDGPKTTEDPKDTASAIVENGKELNNINFEANVKPNASDVNSMKENVDAVYNDSALVVTDSETSNEYINAYNTAKSKLNASLDAVSGGISFVQNFLAYPAKFKTSVQNRLNLLISQAETLSETIEDLLTFNQKKIFENQKTSIILAVAETVTTPNGNEYQNATDVLNVIENVLNLYNNFVTELNGLQTDENDDIDSYMPDAEVFSALNYSIHYAVSNLFAIALEAKQERIIYLNNDDNIINIAHRLYGLLPDDSTIQKIIDQNSIGLNELIQVKAGRKIVYYL